MHGHHTASAMLSVEAFDLAGDPKVYPEQLKYVDTWQPRRLFFNTSWWFYGSREDFEKADKSDMLSVDAGIYYPIKGKSNTLTMDMKGKIARQNVSGIGVEFDNDLEWWAIFAIYSEYGKSVRM